jgi:hypothetical protein
MQPWQPAMHSPVTMSRWPSRAPATRASFQKIQARPVYVRPNPSRDRFLCAVGVKAQLLRPTRLLSTAGSRCRVCSNVAIAGGGLCTWESSFFTLLATGQHVSVLIHHSLNISSPVSTPTLDRQTITLFFDP